MLSLTLLGDFQLLGVFDKLDQTFNPDRVAEEAGAVLLNRIRTRFLHQQDPDGATWPPSHAAIHRAEIGKDGGTLYDTGNLFRSIQLYKEGTGEIGIGTDIPYGIIHQEG